MAHKSETQLLRLLTLQARPPLVEGGPLPGHRGPGPRRHCVVRGEAAGARAGQPRVGAAVEGGKGCESNSWHCREAGIKLLETRKASVDAAYAHKHYKHSICDGPTGTYLQGRQ